MTPAHHSNAAGDRQHNPGRRVDGGELQCQKGEDTEQSTNDPKDAHSDAEYTRAQASGDVSHPRLIWNFIVFDAPELNPPKL